jgi:hypothetical protein
MLIANRTDPIGPARGASPPRSSEGRRPLSLAHSEHALGPSIQHAEKFSRNLSSFGVGRGVSGRQTHAWRAAMAAASRRLATPSLPSTLETCLLAV